MKNEQKKDENDDIKENYTNTRKKKKQEMVNHDLGLPLVPRFYRGFIFMKVIHSHDVQ